MSKRPIPSAEDRLLGILRLERDRLVSQDQGFAALMEEAAELLRGTGNGRSFLPDELTGAAIILRARGKLA